jgi:hypothetical protein
MRTLKCGRLEEGFLRLRCEDCHAEKLVAFSCSSAAPGAPSGSGSLPASRSRRSSPKILAHLEKTAPDQHQAELPLGARAPPSQSRLL